MHTIKIEVSGTCGTGKSAIMYEISKMLHKIGIENVIHDKDAPYPAEWYMQQNNRLKVIAENAFVEIKEVQCNNEAMKNEKYIESPDIILAAKRGDINTVKNLLRNGIDPNTQNKYGSTALMWAVVNGYSDICKLLIKYDADPNLKNNTGDTAYNYAVVKTDPSIANFLKSHSNI